MYKAIVYVSEASRAMSEYKAKDLAKVSKEKNLEKGITGILVYNSGYFLQYLEENADDVFNLLKKISDDERHKNIKVVYNKDQESKLFSKWGMEYINFGMLRKNLTIELSDLFSQEENGDEAMTVYKTIAKVF